MKFLFKRNIQALCLAIGVAGIGTSAAAEFEIRAAKSGQVLMVVNFEVSPGVEVELERHLAKLVQCTRHESGNQVFNVHRTLGAGNSVKYVLYEMWKDEAALKAHFERPYVQPFFALFDKGTVKPTIMFLEEMAPITANEKRGAAPPVCA
ncbi:putative quinol monooxygenase [Roseateles sp. P5_E11]